MLRNVSSSDSAAIMMNDISTTDDKLCDVGMKRLLKENRRNSILQHAKARFCKTLTRKDVILSEEAIKLLNYYLDLERNSFKTVLESIQVICRSQLDSLLFEATWVTINVVSGTAEHTEYIVSRGFIPKLVKLLETSSISEIIDQCIWALGNIAGDSPTFRNQVLSHNVMQILVKIMSERLEESPVLHRGKYYLLYFTLATWCISNLLRGSPPPAKEHILLAIPVLLKVLLAIEDKFSEIIYCSCWALSYAEPERDWQEGINIIMENESAVKKLIEMAADKSLDVPRTRKAVIMILGHVVSVNANHANKLLRFGLLEALIKGGLTSESIWILSNIGNYEKFIDLGIDSLLLEILSRDEYSTIQREVFWTFRNLIFSSSIDSQIKDDFITNILDHNFIRYLKKGIDQDQHCWKPCLDILLELIKNSKFNQKVYQQAKELDLTRNLLK